MIYTDGFEHAEATNFIRQVNVYRTLHGEPPLGHAHTGGTTVVSNESSEIHFGPDSTFPILESVLYE
jgi:hypothetical protein